MSPPDISQSCEDYMACIAPQYELYGVVNILGGGGCLNIIIMTLFKSYEIQRNLYGRIKLRSTPKSIVWVNSHFSCF